MEAILVMAKKGQKSNKFIEDPICSTVVIERLLTATLSQEQRMARNVRNP